MTDERQMGVLSSSQYRVLVWIGFGVIVLIVFNWVMADANDSLRARAAARQQFINESVGLSRLNTELVQALAKLSLDRGDKELREALALYGVSFKNNPASLTGKVPEPGPAGASTPGAGTNGK